MSGANEEEPLFPYTYPEDYTSELPSIVMEPFLKDEIQIQHILEEVGKGDASFCEGLGFDELTEDVLESEGIYGFLYKIHPTNELVGFALFFVNEIEKGKSVTIKGKTYEEGTIFVHGLQRCSKIRGIGRAIQNDIEDFAKHNNIPFIKIQSVTEQQRNSYYKAKFGYVNSNKKESNYSMNLYKVVNGGGRSPQHGLTRGSSKRKTLRRKIQKKKTRKNRKE
jgi:hypothetical protein